MFNFSYSLANECVLLDKKHNKPIIQTESIKIDRIEYKNKIDKKCKSLKFWTLTITYTTFGDFDTQCQTMSMTSFRAVFSMISVMKRVNCSPQKIWLMCQNSIIIHVKISSRPINICLMQVKQNNIFTSQKSDQSNFHGKCFHTEFDNKALMIWKRIILIWNYENINKYFWCVHL